MEYLVNAIEASIVINSAVCRVVICAYDPCNLADM